MDELDFKILRLLDRKCRTPYIEIANKLNLTVRSVSNRVSSLLESGVIKYFSVVFNYTRLGYRLYIGSCSPIQNVPQENLFTRLQKIPEITEAWELLDGTITFPFFIKNSIHLEKVLNRILELNVELKGYSESRMHLSADYPFSLNDWRIIHYLYKNSRAPHSKIGPELNLSEKTVSRRLQRMENMKLAQFVTKINFEAISGMISGVLAIETHSPSKDIYYKIKKEENIKYWRNAGSVSPSIILFLYAKNLSEIYNMYTRIKTRKDIKDCNLRFVVRNWEDTTLIENAILERICKD